MSNTDPHPQQIIDGLLATGKLRRGDDLLSTVNHAPVTRDMSQPSDVTPGDMQRHVTSPGEDPTAVAERLILGGAHIDHIDADGVIHFREVPEPDVVVDGMSQSAAAWLAGFDGTERGLNTDDFSQAPTIDADKSAAWNKRAKTVKPGSFAARRMAAEE